MHTRFSRILRWSCNTGYLVYMLLGLVAIVTTPVSRFSHGTVQLKVAIILDELGLARWSFTRDWTLPDIRGPRCERHTWIAPIACFEVGGEHMTGDC